MLTLRRLGLDRADAYQAPPSLMPGAEARWAPQEEMRLERPWRSSHR